MRARAWVKAASERSNRKKCAPVPRATAGKQPFPERDRPGTARSPGGYLHPFHYRGRVSVGPRSQRKGIISVQFPVIPLSAPLQQMY